MDFGSEQVFIASALKCREWLYFVSHIVAEAGF